MQIHEITHKPLNELAGMRRTNVAKPTTSAAPAPTPVAAPTATATSGSAPAVAAPATAAPASSGSTGRLGNMASAVANTLPGKVVGGTAAVAGGIAGALGKSLMSKAFGGADVMGNKTGAVMNRAQALKAGQEMARTLVPVMIQNWQSKVQTAMAQSKDPLTKMAPTSVSKLTVGEQSRLKAELVAMVNQSIQPRGAFDYTKLPTFVGDTTTPEGQTTKATAMEAVEHINQAINKIFQVTLSAKGDANPSWQDLVVQGIAPAQGVLAFDTGMGGGYGLGARTGAVALTPQQQSLADKYKLADTDILNLQRGLQDPADAPVLAQLLKLPK
jgi:hypothetical protein